MRAAEVSAPLPKLKLKLHLGGSLLSSGHPGPAVPLPSQPAGPALGFSASPAAPYVTHPVAFYGGGGGAAGDGSAQLLVGVPSTSGFANPEVRLCSHGGPLLCGLLIHSRPIFYWYI